VVASRRGRTRETETEGGGVEVNDDGLEEENGSGVLWVGDEEAARSEAGVEAAVCYKAGDEAVACSEVEIKDGRRRRRVG
jgi:hypothetical protein